MMPNVILKELAKLLEVDVNTLDKENLLSDYSNWDSLVKVSVIAIIDAHAGVLLKAYEIEQCRSVNDILLLIDRKKALS